MACFVAGLELGSIKNSMASRAYITTVGTRVRNMAFCILPVTRESPHHSKQVHAKVCESNRFGVGEPTVGSC